MRPVDQIQPQHVLGLSERSSARLISIRCSHAINTLPQAPISQSAPHAHATTQGKIVEGVSFTGLGAFQLLWGLVQEAGLNLMADPSEVRLAYNQTKVRAAALVRPLAAQVGRYIALVGVEYESDVQPPTPPWRPSPLV